MPSQELRYFEGAEVRASSGKNSIKGHAAIFNSLSHDLGGFKEKISPGSFQRSIRERHDVVALFNHSMDKVLGRVRAGTLDLSEDTTGLAFRVRLGNASYARDVLDSVERGDLDRCSFGFRVPKNGDSWDYSGGTKTRTLSDVNLIDVSVVTMPAYEATSVSARSMIGDYERVGTYPRASIVAPSSLSVDELERLRLRLQLRHRGL